LIFLNKPQKFMYLYIWGQVRCKRYREKRRWTQERDQEAKEITKKRE